ncbi:MAG: glycine cleavage T C-terminal barrel domain-containing protein [Rhodospirillales bacterium]
MVTALDYWTRRSPYFEAARRAGCKGWSVANHMYQPHSYDDPLREYDHLVNGVTLWDVATERQVEIAGPDAEAFVDLLTPREIRSVRPGRCRYLIITSEEGGIVNDPVMLRLAEDRFWLSCSDSDLILWAKGVAVFAGMDVRIHEPDVSPLQLQGPKSYPVIETLFGRAVADLGYYRLSETTLDGIPLVVTRTGWSGEFGYELFLQDSRRADDLWDAVLAAGKPHGIAVTGPSDIRRVEAGILGYRCDIDLYVNPFEAGMDRLVDLDKPAAFIGKKALAAIKRDGVRRRIVGIEVGGDALPPGVFENRWPAFADGRHVGEILVALHSPRLGKNIGYAMVETALAAPGTPLTVGAPLGDRDAVVVPFPFVAPSRSRESIETHSTRRHGT